MALPTNDVTQRVWRAPVFVLHDLYMIVTCEDIDFLVILATILTEANIKLFI